MAEAVTAPIFDPLSVEFGGETPLVMPRRRTWRRFRSNKRAIVACAFLGLMTFVALLPGLIAPYAVTSRSSTAYAGISGAHLLGTDDFGRDIFTRIVYATRVSMGVSLSVVFFAVLIALPIGLIAGYAGGRLDNVLMRITDAGLAFPPLVLVLAVAGVLGPGIENAVLALVIVFTPGLIRLVRGQALAVRQETFVDASRAIGTPNWWILARRVLPSVRSVVIVQVTFLLGAALLAEAALSYLGLGAQSPTPTWGNMLRRSYDYALFTHSWQLLIPAAMIVLTVLAFNTLGDGLRDALGVGARERTGKTARRGITAVSREDAPGAKRAEADAVAPNETSPLLDIKGLGIEFATEQGRVRVVDDLDLTIGRGEVVGLAGESGCGKSVTSLAIMRLLASPPATIISGQVMFEGRDLLGLSFRELRKLRGSEISMIFQDPMTSLDPAFTVGSQLVEALRLHLPLDRKTARLRAIELLETVEIPSATNRINDYPHQLSGGMRQRAMIAMALACGPKLLIADEPTTALDVTIQAQILDLLRDLQSNLDMSILFITHDLGVVADICDRVAVMYAGEIVEEATVDDLFASPRHPYTEGLLNAMPQVGELRERLTVIPGRVPTPTAWPSGCRFHPRCPYAVAECTEVVTVLDAQAGVSRTRCMREAELTLGRAR